MRNTFVQTLLGLAQADKNLYLLTGDLGYGALDIFMQNLPNQMINMGIAEQNMSSVAAGMALEGKKIFTYSIANFPTLRCLEQIRNDIAYHNLPVVIVSIGAGMAYGSAGMSHHATEDLAIMRSLPGISVFSPADALETAVATKTAYNLNSPAYIRLGKGGEALLSPETQNLDVSRARMLHSGNDICIFTTGAISEQVMIAATNVEQLGHSVTVYSIPMIKPIDAETIKMCAGKYHSIVTVEEHSIIGGLGSAVAEIIAEMPSANARLVRMGIKDEYISTVGSQQYLRYNHNIDHAGIHAVLKDLLDK